MRHLLNHLKITETNMRQPVFCLTVTIIGLIWLTLPMLSTSLAQSGSSEDNPILFTFGDREVRVNEFKYVYEKNNMGDDSLYTLPSLEEYLDLYINFRLKVREAERMGLDTQQSIQNELSTYRQQLSQSYLTDKEVTQELLQEAYKRMKQARQVSHILIKVDQNAPPEDTAQAYQKAINIRERIMNGEDFSKLAKKHSEDPSAKDNAGKIGYITAFQTVYPFENTAYNTPVGEISKPVRTKYGYHLIRVSDKKPAGKKVKVAHILKKVGKDADEQEEQQAKQELQNIYQKIQEGADFKEMARKHSEDKRSSRKGGMLPEFGVGKMVPKFEDVAFNLDKGEVSSPFRTQYGWHIVKLYEKDGLGSFEKMKPKLKKKVKNDKRSNIAKNKLISEIKNEYDFQAYPDAVKKLQKRLSDLLPNNEFTTSAVEDMTNPIFKMKDTTVQQKDFAHYMNKNTRRVSSRTFNKRFNRMYEQYVEKTLMEYERERLERKYPEFKALMKEYRDGILLFELTDRKVWTEAIEDTMGLRTFYDKNKGNYMWGERADATIYKVKDPDYVQKARRKAKSFLVGDEKLKKKLNKQEDQKVIEIEKGKFEKDANEIIKKVEWATGLSDTVHTENGEVAFVDINEILDPEPKSLEEAKGYVVSDYQEHLEQRWIDTLRKKYPVEVNRNVLRSLAKSQEK